MTRDEIIRLAVECQLVTTGNRDGLYMDALEKFASAVVRAVMQDQTKYTYHPHVSHPGFGWIEPLMDADCPLIEEGLAKDIVVQLQWDEEVMRQALDVLQEINALSVGPAAISLPAEIDGAMDALRERLGEPT